MQTTIEDKLLNLSCEQFFSAIVSNPQFLQKGYQIIYKYLSVSANHRENVLLHLFSQKAPVLTLVTRTYPIVYADNTLNISNEQKLKTKEYLILQVLLKKLMLNLNKQNNSNKKNLSNFLIFLINFHNNQGFEDWVPYYQKLLEELVKINSDLIGFLLIEILKNSDDRVSCFSKHILSFVINNQATLKISEEESLEIIYYCIKSMAYLNGCDDALLQQYFEPFQQKIIQYIYTSMTKSIKIMKFSLKILTVFAADYEIQLQKPIITKIKECAKQLAIQHFNNRIKQNKNQQFEEDQQQDSDNATLSVILYQLLQLFETLLSVEQLKMADYEIYLTVCLPSLLLNKGEYLNYQKFTQNYLADIQDEGQKTLRNKVVSFLLQLYEGEYPSKTKAKLQTQVLNYSLLINQKALGPQKLCIQVANFFNSLLLPLSITQSHVPLIEESINFLLYHLTEEVLTFDTKNLQQNKQSLMMSLGKNVELAANCFVKVTYMNLLNKLIKSMKKSVKSAFYVFLLQQSQKIQKFQQNKGFSLTICRGIAYVSNEVQINICLNQNQIGISLKFIQNIVNFLIDTNTVQESAHLILQFLLTLLKKCQNGKKVLNSLIPSQAQIRILETYVHDGMIADVVIDLLGQIASQQFVNYIFKEFLKGTAKQENLSGLISKWISLGTILPLQSDIQTLLKVYKNSFICKPIKQYLKLVQFRNVSSNLGGQTVSNILSTETISILNDKIHPSWVLPMIGCNILRNAQNLLTGTVYNITYELTSQYQIESQLLLPYYTLLKDPIYGLNILKSHSPNLFSDFFTKLVRYAALFQGPHLKVITSLVLLNICQLQPSKTQPTLQLISSYGNTMQSEEWEDDQDDKNEQNNVIDRMFNMKITNDEIEDQFREIFGQKATDMQSVNLKVNQILAKLGN